MDPDRVSPGHMRCIPVPVYCVSGDTSIPSTTRHQSHLNSCFHHLDIYGCIYIWVYTREHVVVSSLSTIVHDLDHSREAVSLGGGDLLIMAIPATTAKIFVN